MTLGSGVISQPAAMFISADGVYLQARMEDNAECMLVIIGAVNPGAILDHRNGRII